MHRTIATPDPVHAAIGAHRVRWATYAATLKRLGNTRFGSKRDDERVTARNLYWSQTDALLSIVPTTAAGLLDFAQYLAAFDHHEQEPPFLLSDLMATVATALAGIGAERPALAA